MENFVKNHSRFTTIQNNSLMKPDVFGRRQLVMIGVGFGCFILLQLFTQIEVSLRLIIALSNVFLVEKIVKTNIGHDKNHNQKFGLSEYKSFSHSIRS